MPLKVDFIANSLLNLFLWDHDLAIFFEKIFTTSKIGIIYCNIFQTPHFLDVTVISVHCYTILKDFEQKQRRLLTKILNMPWKFEVIRRKSFNIYQFKTVEINLFGKKKSKFYQCARILITIRLTCCLNLDLIRNHWIQNKNIIISTFVKYNHRFLFCFYF